MPAVTTDCDDQAQLLHSRKIQPPTRTLSHGSMLTALLCYYLPLQLVRLSIPLELCRTSSCSLLLLLLPFSSDTVVVPSPLFSPLAPLLTSLRAAVLFIALARRFLSTSRSYVNVAGCRLRAC
jgi:hypothetical protein